jgi:hypothetical protein
MGRHRRWRAGVLDDELSVRNDRRRQLERTAGRRMGERDRGSLQQHREFFQAGTIGVVVFDTCDFALADPGAFTVATSVS